MYLHIETFSYGPFTISMHHSMTSEILPRNFNISTMRACRSGCWCSWGVFTLIVNETGHHHLDQGLSIINCVDQFLQILSNRTASASGYLINVVYQMIGVDLLKAMSADFRHWFSVVYFSRLVYNLTSIKLDTSVGSYLIHVRRFGFWDWELRKACMFFKRVPQVLTSDPIS